MPDEPKDVQPLPPTQEEQRDAMRKAIMDAPITPEMRARRDRWMLSFQIEARRKDAAQLATPLGHQVRALLDKVSRGTR